MGQPTKTQSYRDDPDAVSMHTTRSDYAYESGPSTGDEGSDAALPSYTDSESIATTERANNARARAVEDIYSVMPVGGAPSNSAGWGSKNCPKIGSVCEVSARMDPRLANPDELHQYINDCLQHFPPTPRIYIQGSHTETTRRNNKKETETVTDFQFNLSLGMYLGQGNDPDWRRPRIVTNGESTFRGSWRKLRAPGITQDLEVGGPEERDLHAWVEDYCSNASKLKVFRVSRTVTGLDEKYLKNAIEQVLRRTNYRGNINVGLFMENRAVDIYSEHWVNKWRNGWQRWIFYLTFLWIFTWPILYFMIKRWAIFTVDWPFSVSWPERGEGVRRFATISEEAWLRKHDNLIRRLAIDGFEGDATGLPLEGRAPAARNGRVPSTGNANVDTAVSFIQGGVGVWNSLQGRGGRDLDGWGGDN